MSIVIFQMTSILKTAYINLNKWDLSRIIQFLTLVAILQEVMKTQKWNCFGLVVCVWTRERVCTWACLTTCCCAQKKPSTMAGHRAREVVYWTDKTRTTPVSVQTERAQCLAHHGAVNRKGNNNSRAKLSFTLFSLPLLLPSHIQSTISFWPAVTFYYFTQRNTHNFKFFLF